MNWQVTLHSTMFLLIPDFSDQLKSMNDPLHSTMFLLILYGSRKFNFTHYFTFHNVSINTVPEIPGSTGA